MDLDALGALLAFVDADCNLTRAGLALGLSQPAVHARLTALGRSLDVTLYERRGRRLVLTPAGITVLARAREMVASERLLRAELQGRHDDDAVTMACGEGALVHVVAERVAVMARQHPGRLRFLVRDGPQAVDAVRRGDAQLAVVAGPAAFSSPDLRATTLLTSRLVAIAPRLRSGRSGRSLLGPGPSLGMAALCALPLIVPPVGRPLRTTLDEAAAAVGQRLRVQVEASGWEAVTRLVALGVGVGVINDVVSTTGLVRMPIEGLPAVTYRALRRRGRIPAIVDDVVAAMAAAPV